MNIFLLALCPSWCSEHYCDVHVIKIILEIAQMLCTAKALCDNNGKKLEPKDLMLGCDMPEKTYGLTHTKHPWVLALCLSTACYTWAAELGMRLCEVYTKRFKRTHASEKLIYHLGHVGLRNPQRDLEFNAGTLVADFSVETWGWRYGYLIKGNFCKFRAPLCMPEDCLVKNPDESYNPVESYRNYYIKYKAYMAKWNHSKAPSWWPTPPQIPIGEADDDNVPLSVVKEALRAKKRRRESFKSISPKRGVTSFY